MKYLYMAPCACVLRCLPYHQMSLCVGRLSRPRYEKKLLEHQFLKNYAIERRVCSNVVLRSNRLAVVKFFVEDGQEIYLTATLTMLVMPHIVSLSVIIFISEAHAGSQSSCMVNLHGNASKYEYLSVVDGR